tara:strand:+ start:55 stop:960 length:906 start_codon:yes stop_codon:yes gene_type:complete
MNIKGILQNKSESSKLLIFMIIIFVSYSFGNLITLLFIPNIKLIYLDSSIVNINTFKIAQFILSIFLFIIPTIILSYLEGDNFLTFLGFKKSIKRQNVLLVIMIMLFVQIFVVSCIKWNIEIVEFFRDIFPIIINKMELMEVQTKELTDSFLIMNNFIDLLFNLFLIAIIPAIGEEIFFRGIIQIKLQKIIRNPHLAIFVASFIFSVIHMQFFGFLPRLFLGMLLGYLYYFSANLWMSVIAHFINNALAVILMYPFFSNKINIEITKIDNSNITLIQTSLSILVVFIFIYIYKEINNSEIK